MAALAAPVNDAMTVLKQWLDQPDTKSQLLDAAIEGIAKAEGEFRTDRSFRLPSNPESRRDRFASWVSQYRDRLESAIAESIHRRFPFINRDNAAISASLALRDAPDEVAVHFHEVLEQQRRFAARGIAQVWLTSNVSDGIPMALPTWEGDCWHVPALDPTATSKIADIVVDRDGEVLVSVEEIHKKLSEAY